MVVSAVVGVSLIQFSGVCFFFVFSKYCMHVYIHIQIYTHVEMYVYVMVVWLKKAHTQ